MRRSPGPAGMVCSGTPSPSSTSCRPPITSASPSCRPRTSQAANVEAQAARGDFEFEYPPHIAKKKIAFDGATVHGLCKPVMSQTRNQDRRAQTHEGLHL